MIVEGSEELQLQLERLATKAIPRAAKTGVNAGLSVIARRIRLDLPRGQTGALQNSVGKRLTIKGNGFVEGKAGINVAKQSRITTGAKAPWRAPHAHLYILGTAMRVTKAGANRGRVLPKPSVLRSFHAARQQAGMSVTAAIIEAIRQQNIATVSGKTIRRLRADLRG